MEVDERGFIIPTPKGPAYSKGKKKAGAKTKRVGNSVVYANRPKHTRKGPRFKITDPGVLAKFWKNALRFARQIGMCSHAEDMAQEMTLSYARSGKIRFDYAKNNFYTKFLRKWQSIVCEEADVEEMNV